MLQLNPKGKKKKKSKISFACHFFFLTKVNNKDEIFSAVRMARSDIYIYIIFFTQRAELHSHVHTVFFFFLILL